MSPDEAVNAVKDGATVRLVNAHDRSQYAVGRAISYSLVPTVTVELEPGGSRISWRHDLAEVVTPPKPDEPTGLGAVVEDADGRKWVRTADTDCKRPWSRYSSFDDSEYSDIAAVKVLSEGVS